MFFTSDLSFYLILSKEHISNKYELYISLLYKILLTFIRHFSFDFIKQSSNELTSTSINSLRNLPYFLLLKFDDYGSI